MPPSAPSPAPSIDDDAGVDAHAELDAVVGLVAGGDGGEHGSLDRPLRRRVAEAGRQPVTAVGEHDPAALR